MLRNVPGTRWALTLTAAATLALGASACGGSGPKNKDGLGAAGPIAVGHRKPFPALAGTTLDGAPLNLSAYKGEVVVMNLWASWCDSCEAEAPYLEHAYEAYKDKGVRFVGLDAGDDNAGQARAFVKAKQIGYPNLVDDTSDTLMAKLVGITSLGSVPSTLIIDRNGDLAWRALRPVDYADLSKALGPVMAGQ